MAKDTPQKDQEIKEIGPDKIITLTFPWTEIEPLYTKALAGAAKNLKVPGFRPGKVPAQIAESKIDPEKLAQNTLQKILPEAYNKQIDAEKLEPLVQPEFVLTAANKGADWTVEAHVALRPKIALGDYKKFLVKAKADAIKEIETTEKAKAEEAKKAADEAQKALTKKKDGEKADVVEMDPSLQALTKEQIENQAIDRAVLALRAEVKPVIPEILVKRQAQQQLQELLDQLKQFNIELDDYLQNTGNTFDKLADDLTQDALHRLQLDFLMQALMVAEKLEASDTEIHAEFEKIFAEQAAGAGHHHHHHEHAEGEACDCEEEAESEASGTELKPADYQALLEEREKDPYYRTYVADMVKRRKLVDFLTKLK